MLIHENISQNLYEGTIVPACREFKNYNLNFNGQQHHYYSKYNFYEYSNIAKYY